VPPSEDPQRQGGKKHAEDLEIKRIVIFEIVV